MQRSAWLVLWVGLLPLSAHAAAPETSIATDRMLPRFRVQADAARLWSIEQAYARWTSQAPGGPERAQMARDLDDQLRSLQAEAIVASVLQSAATISLAINLPDRAARIYQRLAAVDPSRRVQWLEQAARQYLASAAPGQAARCYEEAGRQTQVGAEHLRLTLLAMQAHLANRNGRQALQIAKANTAAYAADSAFMQQAIGIALAQQDLAWAKVVGRRLLAMSPRDPDQLERQLQLELAANDLNAARSLAQQLVRLQPESAEQRTRLARIAEWSGQPEFALQNWQHLARSAPTPEVLDRIMQLALALEQDALWLKFAHQASLLRPLTTQELQGLGRVCARAREPGALVTFLQDYGHRHPMPIAQWQALADAQEQRGQLAAALAIWQDDQVIPASASVLPRARLLLRLQRPQEARDLLRAQRAQAVPEDAAYWHAHGDLEWDHGPRQDAINAYLKVWRSGSTDTQVAERLVTAWVELGEWEQASTLASEAYERLDQPRWLLLAMDAAARGEQWDMLRSTAARAEAVEDRLAHSEMYWLLLAHLASHDQDHGRALRAYRHALALQPDAIPLRVQLLAMLLADGQEQELAETLDQWQADAHGQPAYWPVFALGRLRLHRLNDSMDWFERQIQVQPEDYPWQSDYLAWMGSIEPQAITPEVRQAVLNRLSAALLRPATSEGDGRQAVLLRLASMALVWGGRSAYDSVLQDMLELGYRGAPVLQLLVDSSLARNDYHATRRWLESAKEQRLELPAYQHLALALQTNDLAAIAQVLDERGTGLIASDRVSALRRLGHNAQALALAERELLDAPLASNQSLREQRDALRLQQASELALKAQARDFPSLSVRSSELTGSFAMDTARMKLRLAHNTLRGDDLHILTRSGETESEATLAANFELRGDPLELMLGANVRTDNNLVFARLGWAHALNLRSSLHLDLQLHNLSDLTPALRYVGSQDKVAWVLHHAATESLAGHVGLAWQQFNTRSGTLLGQGYRAEAALEKVLSNTMPHWTVRISGSSDNNRLADGLPPDVLGPLLPAGQSIGNVVAANFSTAGVGTTLRWGEHEGLLLHTSGVLDVWAGQQWPGNGNAYAVRAGIHVPLNAAGTARVRLEGHYTNVVGGATAQADRGIGMWLQYRF